MFTSYRAVFARPGTGAFCAAGAVMRMPIAIYPLGLVLLFSRLEHGRFGLAGAMTGIYIVAEGVGAPVLGRLVDRLGQRRVIVWSSVVHVAATLAVVVLVRAHAPTAAVGAAVAVMGLAFLSVGSLIRARWSHVLAGRAELGTAYSLESVLDEVLFVLGPLLASVIATLVDPSWALVLGVVLVSVGAVWLQGQTATEPPLPIPGSVRAATSFRHRGMIVLTLAMAGMGAIFGGVEVTVAAFAGQHGDRPATGVVLAAFALGSGTSGLLYGARQWQSPLSTRFLLNAVVFTLLLPLYLLVDNVVMLAIVAGISGCGIAPTLITGFGLADRLVPAAGLTEGLTWLLTGLNFGYGLSAAVVGSVADAHGARVAFVAPVVGGLVVCAAAGLLRRRVRTDVAPVG